MPCEVIVRAIGDAPQFTPAEGEEELKIGGGLGIERQFCFVMITQTQVLFFQPDRQQELSAERAPVVKPLKVCIRFAEEFQFHLLELSYTEDEVARSDLVAETLADLCDTEWKLPACGTLYIDKVGKDALGRFGAQIHRVLRILRHALESFEHQVELTNVRKIVLAAAGAGDVVFLHKVLHFGL